MADIDRAIASILADELALPRAADNPIAYVGCDIPAELLIASGRVVSHLPWDAERKTPVADRWLEGGFAPWARSMLDDWAAGRFDFFEHVVFSRGDDSAQRLYYYVCELQRRGVISGPAPQIFDIAKIDRPSSIRRSIAAVVRLAERLEIDEASLRESIDVANRRRRIFADVASSRTEPGRLYEQIARASLFADIDDLLGNADFGASKNVRHVLLAGSAPPDDRLHRIVEAAGWDVGGELHERPLDRLGPENHAIGDGAASAIGEHVHQLNFGARGFANRARQIIEAARMAKADAVILWLIEQDEALTWSVPGQMRALSEAGIPVLLATRRRWDARDGIADEIAAFLDEVPA